jgi:hypothetical protein
LSVLLSKDEQVRPSIGFSDGMESEHHPQLLVARWLIGRAFGDQFLSNAHACLLDPDGGTASLTFLCASERNFEVHSNHHQPAMEDGNAAAGVRLKGGRVCKGRSELNRCGPAVSKSPGEMI